MKKSNSGMISTVKKIRDIIELCAEKGVVYFEYDGLRLRFGDTFQATTANSPAKIQDWSKASDNVDEVLLEDARMANLMMEDPLAYEQEMIDKHLAKDKNS